MEILVCISVVPDTTSKIKFKDNSTKFDDNGITYIINPFDEFCLTKAIFIKENSNANITIGYKPRAKLSKRFKFPILCLI